MYTALALAALLGGYTRQDTYTGGRVVVKPVFCIPKGVADPPQEESAKILRHLLIAQARYFELLRGMDTFKMKDRVSMWHCPLTAADLKTQPKGVAEYAVDQLLRRDHLTRWNCPYVYVVLFFGTGDFPGGGARPINGGHNNGGGIVILCGSWLDAPPNMQSTLQHELGHAFGLPHVDAYGYDMSATNSIMAYNPAHLTNFFVPSPTPGNLIPEDLRGLGENKWAFPNFRYDPTTDLPKGYAIKEDVQLGPMDLTLGEVSDRPGRGGPPNGR